MPIPTPTTARLIIASATLRAPGRTFPQPPHLRHRREAATTPSGAPASPGQVTVPLWTPLTALGDRLDPLAAALWETLVAFDPAFVRPALREAADASFDPQESVDVTAHTERHYLPVAEAVAEAVRCGSIVPGRVADLMVVAGIIGQRAGGCVSPSRLRRVWRGLPHTHLGE